MGCLSRRVWLHIYISHCWHATGWQTQNIFFFYFNYFLSLSSAQNLPITLGLPKERVNKNFQILTVLIRGGGFLEHKKIKFLPFRLDGSYWGKILY